MTETAAPTASRDRFAWALCNWVLRHVATDWYRVRIDGAIRYGLAAAARDEQAAIPMPCHVDQFSAEISGNGG